MNKEQFLRGAVSNLESELSATKAELAEMKASLPQIKHDAIMEAIKGNDYRDYDGERIICRSDLVFQARRLLTQAKEQSE